VLPGFLRVNQDEIKKFTSLDNFCRLGTSDSTFNESRMYSRVKLSVLESSKLSGGYNDISQLIFDRNMPSEEILINVGKLSLKREDLHCMQKGLDLNEQVVDVILKLIKRKNKKLIKKGKVKKSIFCLSSNFSAQLFKEGAVVPQKYQKNLLEYDFLIFPAKFNSWTLAVLETRAKMIKFYDPVGINDEKSLVLTQISKFVSSQLKTFAKVEISKTRWANLQIEKIDESEVFPDHDCGIYLFRRVHKYAAQHNKPIHPEALPVYRKRLMEYMFKHSN
jgi:Ulp1 family protease